MQQGVYHHAQLASDSIDLDLHFLTLYFMNIHAKLHPLWIII